MAAPIPASEAGLTNLAERLKEQNSKVDKLVSQGEAQISAQEDAARIAAEAAREAARAADDKGDGPEVAVKVEMEEAPGLFKKLKLGGLAMSFLGTAMTGLTTAFTWLGNAFGPKLLTSLKSIAPWAMILTGLTMAIEDGITGWMKSESWGTSKVSGFLGGFFGGSADGGIKNAFANAGKWALIGAGVGSVVPVVGTIVGGLVGAAIGGILGFIGGKKLAKGFDGIGKWFMEQFNKLILGPIKAVWDFIAPSWAKEVTDKMQWSDLLPPGLTKLFNGEYFTFDMPEFSWLDLFPKFLVDLFNNVTKVVGKTEWSWMDLLPPFLTKFFTGEYAPGKQEFKWQDLVPEFIWKIADVATTAWADTDFTWKSLVPNFILKMIGAVKPVEGSFSWTDLVPKFISDLVAAGKEAGKTEDGGFDWTKLLPDWMGAAWGSTKGLIKQAGGGHLLEGEWWLGLLPDFIANFLKDDKKVDQAIKTAGLAMDWWKSLLPDFIVNIMEGKSPFADRDEGADLKKAEEAKKKLDESVAGLDMPDFSSMFDMSMIFAPIRNKINELAADASFPMSSVYPHLLKLFPEAPIPLEKAEAGGIVGMSPFAAGSMGKAIGLESGGLFTLSQGEFVLDNQAAATFLQAATILKGQDLGSGQNLADLQMQATQIQGGGTNVVIQNNNSSQVNQNASTVVPITPIQPSNGEQQFA